MENHRKNALPTLSPPRKHEQITRVSQEYISIQNHLRDAIGASRVSLAPSSREGGSRYIDEYHNRNKSYGIVIP